MASHSSSSPKTPRAAQKKEPGPFPYSERRVAEKLHLSRKDFRYVRTQTCQRHQDYTNQGRDLVLAQTGLDKILAFLSSSEAANLPTDFDDCRIQPARKKEEPPANGLVELRVTKKFANPRMLLAKNEAGEESVVNVPDSKNFLPGMVLRARQVTEKPPHLFRLEGRCPRFKGRY